MQATERSSSDPLIGCIVLNWNGGTHVLECLQSLQASQDVSVRNVVVDNGSTDGSLQEIERLFPSAHIIRNPNNTGLVSARNEGVRWAIQQGYRSIFLIDNDARVAPDSLKKLFTCAETSPQAGILAPRILGVQESDSIWFDGGYLNAFGDPYHRNMGKKLQPSNHDIQAEAVNIQCATGCAMLVKGAVFETIGTFDERYYAYGEDSDFSLRSQDAGFRILFVPSAIAWHHQSSDTIRNRGKWYRDYYVTRNKLLLASERQHALRWVIFLLYFGIRHVSIPVVYFLLTGQYGRIRALAAGVRDFALKRLGEHVF